MPTSTFAKSRSRKPRRKRGVKPTAQVKGYQLNKMQKQLKRLIPKPEIKDVDVARASTAITSTATITNIAPVTFISASEGGAVGDQFRAKSIFVRLAIAPNATAGVNFLRVIIIKDRQPNGVAPTIGTIFETGASTNYLSPINDTQTLRFKVIFDKTYTVDTDANGAQVDKIYRRLNYKVEGQNAVPVSNGLFMVEISDQAVNGPAVQWYSRFKYIDV